MPYPHPASYFGIREESWADSPQSAFLEVTSLESAYLGVAAWDSAYLGVGPGTRPEGRGLPRCLEMSWGSG